MDQILSTLTEGGDIGDAVTAYSTLTFAEKRELLDRIRSIRNERTALFLTRILEVTAERDLQKSVKKLLFVLKTQGIRVEEPKVSGESVLRKVETVREQMGFLSNYDPEDTRVVLLAFEMKKREFVFMHAVSHFSKGLLELAAVPVARDQLNAILQDYRVRTQRPMVLLPVAARYAQYLVDEAAAVSGTHTDELRSLRPLMTGLKGEVSKPEHISTLAVPEGTRPAGLQAILSDTLFEPFLLSWESYETDRKDLESFINPSIVLPPHIVEERRHSFVTELIHSDKFASTRRSFRRLLQDYAYLFHAEEKFDLFRGIVEGVGSEQFIDDALLFFVRKALEKKEEQKDGVLVDPFKQNPPNPSFPQR